MTTPGIPIDHLTNCIPTIPSRSDAPIFSPTQACYATPMRLCPRWVGGEGGVLLENEEARLQRCQSQRLVFAFFYILKARREDTKNTYPNDLSPRQIEKLKKKKYPAFPRQF